MQVLPVLSLGLGAYWASQSQQSANAWVYRDDIGAYWGIKGYEEQVTEVGTHHGHVSWPHARFLSTFDSGSVRRGFLVFTRNCANCHGIMYKKYDVLLDKAYKQLELAALVRDSFTIHPAHHHFKQYYYQEWDERDRYIHDRIYPPYFSQDQAKNANGGVWPTDFSKIRMRPGGINYIYNILTGYNYKPPYGMDVPKGKAFNPYFDHMIIGMQKQLNDGMNQNIIYLSKLGLVDYDDGTPASAPQMAYDVANFIQFIQRRNGYRRPDKNVRYYMVLTACALVYPFAYFRTRAHYRNFLSVRYEMYAVRDSLYYNHFKSGGKNQRAMQFRGMYWA